MKLRKLFALLLIMPVLLGLSSCMLVMDMFESEDDEIAVVSIIPDYFGNIDMEYDEPYLAYVKVAESVLYQRDIKQFVQHISDAELEEAGELTGREMVTVLGEENSQAYLIIQTQRNIIGYVAAAELEPFDGDSMYRVAYLPDEGVNQALLVDVSSIIPDAVYEPVLAAKKSYLDYLINPELGNDKDAGTVFLSKSWILLDKDSAVKLAAAQKALAEQGYSLKFCNGYYPQKLQYELYRAVNDPAVVPDPKELSRNAQGIAVDVTLVDTKGLELEMPTKMFDFGNPSAQRSFTGASAAARANAAILSAAMESAGFTSVNSCWWHFYDAEREPMIMNQSLDGMILKMMVKDWTDEDADTDAE